MVVLVHRKKVSINFSDANTTFCSGLHCIGDDSYLYVNKTEIYKFKVKDSISWHNYCLGSIPKDFTKDEQKEICMIFHLIIVQLKKKTFLIFTNI